LVTDILLYHVSPGTQDSETVLGSASLDTLQGAEIGVMGTTLVDQDPNAEDAEIVATDIEASNGIAHAVSAVLRPVDLPPEEGAPPPPSSDDDDDDDFWDILLGVAVVAGVVGAFVWL